MCCFYWSENSLNNSSVFILCSNTGCWIFCKSKGIAEDLFGTTENYVIPTQELRTEDQLTKGMQWIIDNKDEIKTHLEEIMPEYKNQVYKVRDILEEMGI